MYGGRVESDDGVGSEKDAMSRTASEDLAADDVSTEEKGRAR